MITLTRNDKPDYSLSESIINAASSQGIYINYTKLKELYVNIEQALNNQVIKFQAIYGVNINLNSSKQLLSFLIDICGIPEADLKYRGKPTTNADKLEEVYIKYQLEPIKDILNYKKLSAKMKSLKDIINNSKQTSLKDKDGNQLLTIHPKWSRSISYRYYSSKPNIQNMNNEFKTLIAAPKDYKILSIDIRQQEPIILFHYLLPNPVLLDMLKKNTSDYYMTITQFALSKEYILYSLGEELKKIDYDEKAILESNLRNYFLVTNKNTLVTEKKPRYNIPYKVNHSVITNLIAKTKYPLEKIDTDMRSKYKTCTLAGGYGAGESLLQEMSDPAVGTSFFETLKNLPEMQRYSEYTKQQISKKNYTVQSFFGTPSVIEYRSYGYVTRNYLNRPVQTTGADLLSIILCLFKTWRVQNKLTDADIRLIYPRHDEILFLIKETLVNRITEIMNFCEFQIEDWAPMYSEYQLGDTYF